MKKNKKILTKKLFEATYVASDPKDVKDLKTSGVLSKDDTVMMDDEKTSSSSNNDSMALSEDCEEQKESPIKVEYLSNMKGEKPFEIHGDKYEYVYGKYPDGTRKPAVYCYKDDITISEDWFNENIAKHKENLDENSNINRPKDAKGNDITIKARVIVNNSEIGHVLQFGLNDKNEEVAIVELIGGRKVKVPFNQIVVDDNNRIVREINLNETIKVKDQKKLFPKVKQLKNIKYYYDNKGILYGKKEDGWYECTEYGEPLNNKLKEKVTIVNKLNEQEQNDVVDGTNIPKLKQDVKVLVDKIETVLKPYLEKINKPVEQAELIAAIAERIGIPREKLSSIISQLRTISNKTNIVQQDVTSTSQIAETRKVIKTIKVKDIKKK